ncbi:MAG: hypothetical protein Q4B60_08110 [Erysipelotrichaceae bacterium]|nr:hypothetical protein [Erysipelotrichaceae bacterium]
MSKKNTKASPIKNLPYKRSINVVGEIKKKVNNKVLIPMVLIAVILTALAGKFLVLDRFMEMYSKQAQVADLQIAVTAAYDTLAKFGDLNETYAHYTYSGFNSEELYRTSRTQVLDLIDNKVRNKAELISLNLSGNQCAIQIRDITLGMAKDIANDLKEDDIVDFCIVTNANTGSNLEYINENQKVTAQITVYLNPTFNGGAQ